MSRAWTTGRVDEVVVAAKGAPEAIAELCHLEPNERALLLREVATLASAGLRVLGVAKAQTREGALPSAQRDLRLTFVGLVGLEDPLRPTVPPAVKECTTAGVRVVMITGGYPATALSIARQQHAPDAARGLTFATLVVAFLAVILVNRSWARSALSMLRTRNAALRWVLLGTTGLLAIVLFVPAVSQAVLNELARRSLRAPERAPPHATLADAQTLGESGEKRQRPRGSLLGAAVY